MLNINIPLRGKRNQKLKKSLKSRPFALSTTLRNGKSFSMAITAILIIGSKIKNHAKSLIISGFDIKTNSLSYFIKIDQLNCSY